MDKNAIKKFAVWARRELIERVSQRAMIFGISAENVSDPNVESVNGRLLSQTEKNQRQALIRNIKEKGFEQVMEEVAYTWFNRFAALRFMEVNGYLPSHIRVFTNDAGEFKPQILAEAIHLELPGFDMKKVYDLENANKSEDLFKYLLIVQCNALNDILPGMFQKIDDYTELLLPDNLLREGSVIEQMVTTISEEDWTDQVQIIGWLYQYYIAEPKDERINTRKQYNDEDIPFVTQLFTSEWIVHFMVENSLGRLWLEGHPDSRNRMLPTTEEQKGFIAGHQEKDDFKWHYYLERVEQEPEVEAKLAEIQKEYANLKPEEILVIDPCMGSGHILCVFFDVLVRIYEDYGYTAREAASKIVENNLWGLDIDERAGQLAYFSVMMKARQYDRRFFTQKVQPHVYAIEESNSITTDSIYEMDTNLTQEENAKAMNQVIRLVKEMHDAKEYGSIIHVTPCDWDLLRHFALPREKEGQLHLDIHGELETSARLQRLINIGEALSQKYNVVVTNPPYMSSSYMPNKLKDYVQKNYTDFKNDMFAVFIKQVLNMTVVNGHIGLLMPYVWMFISSFEKVRDYLNSNATISTLVQLEYNAFEAACVPVAALTLCKNLVHFSGEYIKLSDFRGAENQGPRTLEAVNNRECGFRFTSNQKNFCKIPGSPVAFWVRDAVLNAFEHGQLSEYATPKQGLATGDNNRFLRFWQEVGYNSISFSSKDRKQAFLSKKKWFPCNKGGAFRRWYGNREYLVNWESDGFEIRNNVDEKGKQRSRPQNVDYYFMEGMTWSTLSAGLLSMRYSPVGSMFETKGSVCFPKTGINLWYLLGLLNTKVVIEMLRFLSPTLDFHEGPIGKVPVLFSTGYEHHITDLVRDCVQICKEDWDSFESSWDFKEHPFLTINCPVNKDKNLTIKQSYEAWKCVSEERFAKLKKNEEDLNRIFIDIYGLSGELTPEVEDKDITVRRADLQRDTRSFLSYAVGCMFGRYSLETPGLAYAGGEWDESKYTTFQPDRDAIIPICDDEYFDDDIVGRFVKFVEVVYGKETLEENLQFVADALGGKGSSREIIRDYFINDFYPDHLKVYQKRPIYWLFDSGKKNGFKCLIYMHRYQPDTLARIRTDYVHEQQSRYRTAIADVEQRMNGASTSERVKLSKQLDKLHDQSEEIRIFEEKIHHLADQMIKIDLDDGVVHNYELFKDVLAKIK